MWTAKWIIVHNNMILPNIWHIYKTGIIEAVAKAFSANRILYIQALINIKLDSKKILDAVRLLDKGQNIDLTDRKQSRAEKRRNKRMDCLVLNPIWSMPNKRRSYKALRRQSTKC